MNTYPITSGRILKGKNLEDVTEFDFLKSGLTLKIGRASCRERV